MECVTKPNINCCQGGNCSDSNCPSSHGCCWQQPEKGNPTLGLCVKKDEKGGSGNCDFKRGIPVKNCRDSNNPFHAQNTTENFSIKTREGYDDKNCDCNQGMWIGILVVILTIFLLIFYKMSRKAKNKSKF